MKKLMMMMRMRMTMRICKWCTACLDGGEGRGNRSCVPSRVTRSHWLFVEGYAISAGHLTSALLCGRLTWMPTRRLTDGQTGNATM